MNAAEATANLERADTMHTLLATLNRTKPVTFRSKAGMSWTGPILHICDGFIVINDGGRGRVVVTIDAIVEIEIGRTTEEDAAEHDRLQGLMKLYSEREIRSTRAMLGH